MVKISKEELARAVYDLNQKLDNLEKKVDLIINKFNVSLDVLEKRVNELENLIAILDEDYYNIKKETSQFLTTLKPYLGDLKDESNFRKTLLREVKLLSESLERVSEILRDHSKRIKKLENIQNILIKEA